jgi:hypothetical protein
LPHGLYGSLVYAEGKSQRVTGKNWSVGVLECWSDELRLTHYSNFSLPPMAEQRSLFVARHFETDEAHSCTAR